MDPKKVIRKTVNGDTEVVELRVATNPHVGSITYTNYYNITVWPGRFEGIIKKLGKGSAVHIFGVLYQVEYKDKNGKDRVANNVNLLLLTFPVADSEEAFAKRKRVRKAPAGGFLDDSAAIISSESPVEDPIIEDQSLKTE